MTDTITFEHLQRLWLLVAVAGLVAWAAVQHVRRGHILARLGEGPVVQRLIASYSPRRSAMRIALWGTALALLVVASARPRYGLRETEVSNAGIDVAIVVDASKSMLVKDVLPSRLQGTALEIKALLDRMAGGRVALIPFAGIPFVQCPLTTDREVILMYLGDLKPEDIPVGGTNVGRAITLAIDTLTGEKERAEAEQRDNLVPQFKGSKNKAIVLFTDGEDHEGAAVEAAQKAAAQGIKIFTVGVGSALGNPVPVLGSDGSAVGVVKDDAGMPIFSKLNMPLLEQIAAATGGKALHYGGKSVVPQLFQALDQLEKAEYNAQFKQLGEDRYQVLLLPALLLLLVDSALTNRRRGRRGRNSDAKAKSAPSQGKSRAAIAALLLCLGLFGLTRPALAVPAWLQHENGDIREGREKLEQKQYGEALKAFQEAQATRPEHVLIWYDIGLAQAAMGAWQDAMTSLARALGGLREHSPALEADIHYATGTLQLQWASQLDANARGKKVEPAKEPAKGKAPAAAKPEEAQKPAPEEDPLPHYRSAVTSLEQALLADPTRVATRRNLEIARLGAFPPCRNRDKKDEPNDQFAQATPVAFAEGQREQPLEERACPEDRDLFRIELQPGDRFSAKVATKADPNPVSDPDGGSGAPARLGLQLLSADGKDQLRGAPQGQPPLDAVDLGKVDSKQTVLVDVRNVAEVETPYDLTLKLLPACQRIEDKFEPNDTPQQARAIPIGQPVKGRLCPVNDDYFSVMMQPEQGLVVHAKAKVDIGTDKIELEVLDPSGNVVAHGRPGKDGLTARLAYAQEAGAYVVQVRGGIDTEADYDLGVEVLPPCRERDDRYEDNDQALQANPLDASMIEKPLDQLQLCPGDDDWYAVDLQAGESLFVDLQAAVEELPDVQDLAGALTVEVYDERGVQWGKAVGGPVSQGGAVVRTTAVLAPPPGKYRVRVTGGGVAGPTFPLPPLPPGSVQLTSPQGNPGAQPDPDDADPGMAPGPALPPAPQPGITATPRPGSLPPGLMPPGSGPGSGSGSGSGSGPGSGPGPGPGSGPGNPQGPAAEPQAPVPHVILPPGTVVPEVDRAQARLDLPYTLKLRILPPCPAGNDELEPNDSAAAAKPLEVGQEQLMRICKGDQDWVQIAQKAGQNLQISARYDLSHGPISMEVFDEAGTQSISKGERRGAEGAKGAPADDTPEARKGRTSMTAAGIPGGKADRLVKVRLGADKDVENFYVLRVEEPPPPSDKGQDKDKDKKDDDKQDQDKKDQEKKEQDKKDQEKKDEPKPDAQERERLKQQMQRNDHDPQNLEALEAMRKSQFRNETPAKDW